MHAFLQDVRFAIRSARAHMGFSAVVVATLGLGIGANATIFSVVHGLVLNPFPFPDPDRIVGVGTAFPQMGSGLQFVEHMSPAEFEDIRDGARTLEEVVAWDMGNRQIAGEGPPQNVFTGFWWGNALQTLGMEAHLGRGFTAEESERGDAVALISHRLWLNRFGADSTLIGSTLEISGSPHTLVGVLPPGVLLYGMDLWTVMPAPPGRWARNRRQFQVLARVREGHSLREVNAELDGMARRIELTHGAEFEEYQGWDLEARTWAHVSSSFFRTGLFIVMGAVGFVLLLVCANVANLLLARAQGRRREMAVRTALGAGRPRLIAQLLTESVLLASLGGLVGMGLAFAGARWIQDLLTRLSLPVAGDVEVNLAVLGFTASVAVMAGVLFGLVPAFQGSRSEIGGTLQAEGKGATTGARRQRAQRTLVAVEVALAFVLLSGGGLLVNSLLRLQAVDPGFDHENVLTMRLTLPSNRYEPDEIPPFFEDLTQRVEALPGVRSAAAGTQYPPVAFAFREIWIEGMREDPEGTLPVAMTTAVTPDYHETLGLRLLAGRLFDDGDRAGTSRVAILNAAAAARYFPNRDPVGGRLKIGGPDAETPWWEIVGVVASARNRGLDQEPYPEVFAVHDQVGGSANQVFLLVRTEGEPRALLPAVREVVTGLDPDQPVYAIRTIEEAFAQAAASRRGTTLFLTLFALFALALAAAGIYAVVSFAVSSRTQEIGVRIALGADSGRVRRLVVRQALLPVVAGAAAGTALTLPLSRALENVLFEVRGADPTTLLAAGLVLLAVAAAASWLPAWRAGRLDPVEALRVD